MGRVDLSTETGYSGAWKQIRDASTAFEEARVGAMNHLADQVIEDGGVTWDPRVYMLAMHGESADNLLDDDLRRLKFASSAGPHVLE